MDAGKTIAEIHGLVVAETGKFVKIPETEQQIFVDPEIDDNPIIKSSSSLSVFWRITILNRMLGELFLLEESLFKMSLSWKNTSSGCWISFTSKKIAERYGNKLKSHNIDITLEMCDINGLVLHHDKY